MGILISKKHNQFCILLLLGIVQKPYAQVLSNFHFHDPFTINVAGKYNIIHDVLYDWSFGEMAIHTMYTKPTFYISLGFLQSNYYPFLQYKNLDSFDIKIKIGPNPFSNYIVIQSQQDQLIINCIQLLDFQGKVLYQVNGDYAGLNFYYKLFVKKLNSPMCFLNISYTISDHINRKKYFKLLQN